MLNRFDIAFEKNHLLQALTHNSFSDKNNSRYVFLGQFAFKGKVAEWIFDNVAGTGTQLQHFLGNIFSQKFLETYFDKNFDTIKRIDATVNINTQKHGYGLNNILSIFIL